MNITESTPWIIAASIIPAEQMANIILQQTPANIGQPLIGFSIKEINNICSGEFDLLLKILGKEKQVLTTGTALQLLAWIKKEMDGIKNFYEKINTQTAEEKKISNTLETLDFFAGACVRAVKYFNLKSIAEAENTRLADVMLMDKAAAIDADFQRKLLKTK